MNKIKIYINKLTTALKNTKPNSLKINIWLFLTAFSIFILCFLWVFQIIFLGSYYKSYKTEELDKAAKELRESINLNQQIIDEIARKRDICIQYSIYLYYLEAYYNFSVYCYM